MTVRELGWGLGIAPELCMRLGECLGFGLGPVSANCAEFPLTAQMGALVETRVSES